MATARSVKPWKLTEDETFSSYTSWQQNITYCLSQDTNNQPFLLHGSTDATWEKVGANNPFRGLVDGSNDGKPKKEEKLLNLQSMLGYICQFVPHYLSNDIINTSTSINSVWSIVRQYYGFQQSEVQFLKFTNITWEGMHAERPERLYRRILAHIQDNLLQAGSKLKHNGVDVTKDELISPTVERLAVLRWMELIHPKLPALVARTFAYDLQRMTLKDIQPQIADGLDNFLEELNRDEAPIQVSKVYAPHRSQPRRPRPSRSAPQQQQHRQRTNAQSTAPRTKLQCRVCRAENRPFMGHDMASCHFIAEAERRALVRAYQIDVDYDEEASDLQESFDDPHVDSNE